MILRQTSLAACLLVFSLAAAAEPAADRLYFFDETTQRHLALEKADFGNTRVTVRFAMDPGSSGTWTGGGVRKDKVLSFARNVNEGEDRGTFFIAEISESKVVVGFKEGQKDPQDAGINGTYKRASETRLLQLLKKEFQAANERLTTALKNASKAWASSDRAALGLWKDQWPAMRQRWVDANLKSAAARAADPRAPQQKPAEPTAEQWLKTAQATARGYGFIEAMPDPRTGTGWDGEYDDFGGGHASLRLSKDGKLRVSLVSGREEGQEASTLDTTVPPEQVRTDKGGVMTAEFTFQDAEAVVKNKPARFKLTKLGRYLRIEAEDTRPYAGKGWFDGIYRGAPVPQE
jgi:hypothetical protein